MGHVARGIGAAILLAAVGGALAAPQIGPPVGGPKTPRDAPATLRKPEDVKKDLMAAAAKGKVTGPVLALFREYATARAREKLVPDAVPEAFWNWLGGSKELREAVVLGLYAYDHDAGVVKTLQALRSKFGDRVRTYPHLAMAFAFVYGRAGGKSIREPPVGFVNEGRGVPSMEESFEYYLKNEKQMRMSLKTTPWPMLIFVADNDAPIEEREWALQHYADLQPGAFGKVYYHVPYDYDSVGGKGKIGDRPRTLDNILQYGGVCATGRIMPAASSSPWASRASTIAEKGIAAGTRGSLGSGATARRSTSCSPAASTWTATTPAWCSTPSAANRCSTAKFNSASPPWSVRIRGASTRPRPASRT